MTVPWKIGPMVKKREDKRQDVTGTAQRKKNLKTKEEKHRN